MTVPYVWINVGILPVFGRARQRKKVALRQNKHQWEEVERVVTVARSIFER
jgi:hypothetical protein